MEEGNPNSEHTAVLPLVVHRMSNGMRGARSMRGIVSDATIWGGDCFNCGEDNVSTLVQAQREHLRRFIYLPESHKGGRMVRPLYCRGDRSSTMQFPLLKTLGYYEDCGTPLDARWIVPNLETLYVFDGGRRRNGGSILDRWKASGNHQSLPMRVLTESPNIQEIIVAQPDFTEPFQFQVIRRLYPCPLAWPTFRLIQVVLKKENPITCPMAMLPEPLVNHILAFCPRGHFESVDYDEKEEDDESSDSGKDGEVAMDNQKRKAK